MAVKGKMTKMKMSDGAEIGVYHVEPQGARRGGLVLIQEIFGVTEHIMECCDSYAAEGYEVLGPALYDREVPGFQASYSPEDIQKAIKIARGEHPFDLSITDTQTCIDALKGKGAVFITGYCYGGSVTWAAAGRCEGLAAASGFYGGNIPAPDLKAQPEPLNTNYLPSTDSSDTNSARNRPRRLRPHTSEHRSRPAACSTNR